MATNHNTGKSIKSKKPNKTQKSLLEQFLAELGKEIDTKEGNISRKMTKGQALVKSMVNEALKGDSKMLANVIKLIDKLDRVEEEKEPEEKTSLFNTKFDWEHGIFTFYGKYKHLLEGELERLRKENPDSTYWLFEFAHHKKLEHAPWYKAVYVDGDKV